MKISCFSFVHDASSLLPDNAYSCDPRIKKFKEEEKAKKEAEKKAKVEAKRKEQEAKEKVSLTTLFRLKNWFIHPQSLLQLLLGQKAAVRTILGFKDVLSLVPVQEAVQD